MLCITPVILFNSEDMLEYKTANGNKIRVEVSTSVQEVLEETDRKIQSQGRFAITLEVNSREFV